MKKGAFDYKSKYCEYGSERTKKLNASNKNTFRSVVTTRQEKTNHLYSCLSCDYMKCFFLVLSREEKHFQALLGFRNSAKYDRNVISGFVTSASSKLTLFVQDFSLCTPFCSLVFDFLIGKCLDLLGKEAMCNTEFS